MHNGKLLSACIDLASFENNMQIETEKKYLADLPWNLSHRAWDSIMKHVFTVSHKLEIRAH